MKIPSNKIKDIKRYMHGVLGELYPEKEITAFTEILLEAYAGIQKTDFYLYPEKTVNESVLLKVNTGIKLLKKYTPIQYIIGYTHFCGLKISVNHGVLIPRPETEELTTLVLKHLETLKEKDLNLLDACTGSGAIALALKQQHLASSVYAFDISEQAIKTAKQNAIHNNLNIRIFKADIFDNHLFTNLPLFDVIVSNPPYVRVSEKKLMQPNVLEYEPELALFVNDENPLLYYDALAKLAQKLLKTNGVLFCEINEALGKDTLTLFEINGFKNNEITKDIYEKDRFVCVRK